MTAADDNNPDLQAIFKHGDELVAQSRDMLTRMETLLSDAGIDPQDGQRLLDSGRLPDEVREQIETEHRDKMAALEQSQHEARKAHQRGTGHAPSQHLHGHRRLF